VLRNRAVIEVCELLIAEKDTGPYNQRGQATDGSLVVTLLEPWQVKTFKALVESAPWGFIHS
jgi:hypothetical protein